jgi:DNA-binding MarR family transcriptional regulator
MSDTAHQDKATISRAISDLEKKGIIVKLPNKSHKRSPLIWMTEQGKALYDNIVPTFTEQASQFTNVLSAKEKNQLCELLDKLKNHIELVKEEQGLN